MTCGDVEFIAYFRRMFGLFLTGHVKAEVLFFFFGEGNGLFKAGQGIDPHLYKNRGVHYAPRFGFAYDVTGEQKFVARGGFGVFYDRAAGDTVYGMLEQPPTVAAPVLLNGRLQDVSSSTGTLAPPVLAAFDYRNSSRACTN